LLFVGSCHWIGLTLTKVNHMANGLRSYFSDHMCTLPKVNHMANLFVLSTK
jgi:succinate dehydrogenase/fumarate reductase cytochrome b subunit